MRDISWNAMKNERTPVTERLAMHGDIFTASDAAIADHLLRNYPKSLMQNASEVAEALELNIATVTRFFMKLGYSSAKEALSDFKEELAFIIDSPVNRYGESKIPSGMLGEEIAGHLQVEQENIAKTLTGIDMATLHAAVDLILDTSRKIFIVGTMKEYSVALYLYKQLFSLRENVFLVREPFTANFMAVVDDHSVCVVLDFRRYANRNRMIAKHFKQVNAKVVAISDSRFCPTALLADHQFTVVSKSLTMFDSYTAAMSLVNLLMVYIMKSNGRGFKENLDRLDAIYVELDTFSMLK
jgi:DNA-binding MurR/RpiR family transcriptional regulator